MAEVNPPTIASPSTAPTLTLKGCLKGLAEFAAAIVAIIGLPPAILGVLVHWAWPWYSSTTSSTHNLDNALIALASVAGVLWSGAIVAYSIHKKYTPPLRTGVQLLNFGILAPLAGLIGEGATLRTAFYFAAWFFIIDTAFSMTNLEMLRAGKFSFKAPPEKPNETLDDIKRRVQLVQAQDVTVDFFKRVAHGTTYFAVVSALCIAIFINGSQGAIAWSCLTVLLISLFLMLPEIFNLSEPTQSTLDAGEAVNETAPTNGGS